MNPTQLIARKRDGESLADDETAAFIDGYVAGDVPDYQMAAFAMAVYIRGMQPAETAALTECMLCSGVTLDWPEDGILRVDKHSTGGIGDKTSLILAPLLACCDVQVPMISGRGLGPTGGTLDKLESIPGYRTDLSLDEIQSLTQSVGCIITGATEDLVPADRKLYALRDVTATVPSIPLITASIMSKKLAEGLDRLVLDVKFGSGAFMKTLDDARVLARSMVETGERLGVQTTALLTDMNQPLGRMIGNAVEVDESIDCLRGEGRDDLRELTLALAAQGLLSDRESQDVVSEGGSEGKRTANGESPLPCISPSLRLKLTDQLASGRAFEKFEQMVAAQGGDVKAKRPVASRSDILAQRAGYITAIDTEALGYAVIELGGGRKVQTDRIDHRVGLEILVRIGDRVDAGQPLLAVFADDATRVGKMINPAMTIADDPVDEPELIVEQVGE